MSALASDSIIISIPCFFQKIAHQSSYMTDVDYIDTLIQSEKSETNPGNKTPFYELNDTAQ